MARKGSFDSDSAEISFVVFSRLGGDCTIVQFIAAYHETRQSLDYNYLYLFTIIYIFIYIYIMQLLTPCSIFFFANRRR